MAATSTVPPIRVARGRRFHTLGHELLEDRPYRRVGQHLVGRDRSADTIDSGIDELGLQPGGKTIRHHVARRQRTERVGQLVGVDHDRPAPDPDQEHGGSEAEHPTCHTDGEASAAIPGAQLITRAGLVLMRGRLSTTALARPSNASAASEPGSGDRDRMPFVGASPHRRQQGDLSHEIHAQLGGQRGTASASKQLIALVVVRR